MIQRQNTAVSCSDTDLKTVRDFAKLALSARSRSDLLTQYNNLYEHNILLMKEYRYKLSEKKISESSPQEQRALLKVLNFFIDGTRADSLFGSFPFTKDDFNILEKLYFRCDNEIHERQFQQNSKHQKSRIEQTKEPMQSGRTQEFSTLLDEHIAAVEQVIRRDEQRLKEDATNESLSKFLDNTKEYLSTLVEQKKKCQKTR